MKLLSTLATPTTWLKAALSAAVISENVRGVGPSTLHPPNRSDLALMRGPSKLKLNEANPTALPSPPEIVEVDSPQSSNEHGHLRGGSNETHQATTAESKGTSAVESSQPKSEDLDVQKQLDELKVSMEKLAEDFKELQTKDEKLQANLTEINAAIARLENPNCNGFDVALDIFKVIAAISSLFRTEGLLPIVLLGIAIHNSDEGWNSTNTLLFSLPALRLAGMFFGPVVNWYRQSDKSLTNVEQQVIDDIQAKLKDENPEIVQKAITALNHLLHAALEEASANPERQFSLDTIIADPANIYQDETQLCECLLEEDNNTQVHRNALASLINRCKPYLLAMELKLTTVIQKALIGNSAIEDLHTFQNTYRRSWMLWSFVGFPLFQPAKIIANDRIASNRETFIQAFQQMNGDHQALMNNAAALATTLSTLSAALSLETTALGKAEHPGDTLHRQFTTLWAKYTWNNFASIFKRCYNRNAYDVHWTNFNRVNSDHAALATERAVRLIQTLPKVRSDILSKAGSLGEVDQSLLGLYTLAQALITKTLENHKAIAPRGVDGNALPETDQIMTTLAHQLFGGLARVVNDNQADGQADNLQQAQRNGEGPRDNGAPDQPAGAAAIDENEVQDNNGQANNQQQAVGNDEARAIEAEIRAHVNGLIEEIERTADVRLVLDRMVEQVVDRHGLEQEALEAELRTIVDDMIERALKQLPHGNAHVETPDAVDNQVSA